MKKKVLLPCIIGLAIIVLLGGFLILKSCGVFDRAASNSVDTQIRELLDNEEYINADTEQKQKMANNLLTTLKKQNKITGFSYNEDNLSFSFVYKDHSLGGIYLQDFSAYTNAPLGTGE